MIYPRVTYMLTFLKTLVQGLKPYAQKKNIKFDFTVSDSRISFESEESVLLKEFTKLIASIIDYVPDNNTIYLNATLIKKADAEYISVKIRNTGINLKMVMAILKNSSLPVTLFSSAPNETTYEVCFLSNSSLNIPVTVNGTAINYISVVKGIQTHFAKLNNPVARLTATKPKEAAFLIAINKCIVDNISDERFDANALSTAMCLSRAQLLRRLKLLTGNSPGFYIKTQRLEKAKELLETSDLSVSEAAFKTGFGTPSNFSKVFFEKYGITPSQFRRINPNATNK
jgi:AraC-like DNA-binding protein